MSGNPPDVEYESSSSEEEEEEEEEEDVPSVQTKAAPSAAKSRYPACL